MTVVPPADRALATALAAAERALARGDTTGADRAFAAARRRAPADVTLALAHAGVFRASGDVPRARALLEAACETTDWRAATDAHALGTALVETGAATLAVRCFAHVTAVAPRDPAAHAALASALRVAGRPEEAWQAAERALALDADKPATLVTAAQIRHDLGDAEGAAHWFDRADTVRPGHDPTRLQRAYTVLMEGASASGWALLEARSQPVSTTGATRWRGEPIAGRSIAVLAEQGVGDQFQFLRFTAHLGARGASAVIVEAHPSAVSLLRAGGFTCVPRGEAPPTDLYVPLLSLPHLLGIEEHVDGARVPYIAVEAPSTDSARAEPALHLGIVWAGNPAFPGRETRDLDPALLPELATVPGVVWHPLQQGEAAAAGVPLFGEAPALADWLATARRLAALDGLVTTDTGIAHLAGAMGIRTWVLLQHAPDWRWGRRGERTPWYPTLRLARQAAPRDWMSAVHAVRDMLAEAVAEQRRA